LIFALLGSDVCSILFQNGRQIDCFALHNLHYAAAGANNSKYYMAQKHPRRESGNKSTGRKRARKDCVLRAHGERVTLLPGEAAVFVFSRLSSVIS
jgi:hypothetical protein